MPPTFLFFFFLGAKNFFCTPLRTLQTAKPGFCGFETAKKHLASALFVNSLRFPYVTEHPRPTLCMNSTEMRCNIHGTPTWAAANMGTPKKRDMGNIGYFCAHMGGYGQKRRPYPPILRPYFTYFNAPISEKSAHIQIWASCRRRRPSSSHCPSVSCPRHQTACPEPSPLGGFAPSSSYQ